MVTHDSGEGVLLGLACGDALGEPVEGWSADRIAAEYDILSEFVGGRAPPGGLTDDTEQALRVARSLVERDGFDPDDVSRRFVEWFEGGAVGIGGLTRRVLRRIADGDDRDRLVAEVRRQIAPELFPHSREDVARPLKNGDLDAIVLASRLAVLILVNDEVVDTVGQSPEVIDIDDGGRSGPPDTLDDPTWTRSRSRSTPTTSRVSRARPGYCGGAASGTVRPCSPGQVTSSRTTLGRRPSG